jgi:MarR family 2-MHQ and catechol resistance regulon transcriptional repressor
MNEKKNKRVLEDYINAYSFIEFSSGKTIINIWRTVGIVRLVYSRLFDIHKISETKFFVILLLNSEDDGMTLTKIGENMLVSKANITTLINRMEKDGIVEKKENFEDKRSKKAYLTPKGKEIFNKIKYMHKEFSEKMTKSLDEDEKKILNKLLIKMQLDITKDFRK